MTDHRSPEDIERDIERQRAGLSNTIEDLQDRFSLDGVVEQLTDQLRRHGGEIGASVSRSVRNNPMALALTGVGLAWMIFGNRDHHRRSVSHHGRTHPRADRRNWSHDDDDDRSDDWSDGGIQHDSRPGRARGIAGSGVQPAWVRRFDDPYGKRDKHVTHGSSHSAHRENDGDDDSGDWTDKARDMGAAASDSVSSMGQAASQRAASMGQAVSDRAADLRRQLSEGTETLGEEARERVIAARERAWHASAVAMDQARESGRKAADLYDDQPLIAGALAVALGAAVAAALPRTRIEDRYMGAESDALIDEAERIFEQERAKATQVAKAAMDEAGAIVDEAKGAAQSAKDEADRRAPGDNAAQAMADKAGEAGQRVADAAKAEAKKQELGKTDV